MNEIKLVYIDDQIDTVISGSLHQYCKESEDQLEYLEVQFLPQYGYESILVDEKVRTANIIIIDDRLFEERAVPAQNGKVTGEEFKLVLRKYLPFIETIVITQNRSDEELGTLPKYKYDMGRFESAEDYYANLFKTHLKEAIRKVKIYRRLSEKFRQNTNWETVIQEKVINSLQGMDTYDELTKSDIDSLIQAFKEVERQIENG